VTEPNDPRMQTGQSAQGEEPPVVAPPLGGDNAPLDEASATAVALQEQLAERTADLQRLQAEYVNYKRRVDRDRDVVRDNVVAVTLTALLPVLDDIDRARLHGELTGGFKAVAESLERTVTALGLSRFGTAGEPFDPRVHEALMSEPSADVDGPTAQAILQPGYRVGERVVRPARVAVAEPVITTVVPTIDEAEAPEGVGAFDPGVAGADSIDDELVDAELVDAELVDSELDEPEQVAPLDGGAEGADGADGADGRVGGGVRGRGNSTGT